MNFILHFRLFWRRASLLVLVVCLLVGIPVELAGAADELTLSTIYTFPDDTYPSALVYGPQNAFWLTLKKANALARLNVPGEPQLLSPPTANSTPFDIAIGPDANVWFTEQKSGVIGRIDADNQMVEFPLEDTTRQPSQIVLGQDGGMWFTEFLGNRIGRIDVDGVITEYELPHPNSHPLGITSDQEGILWFTEWYGNRIGRIDTQGNITEYPLPAGLARPTEIALGPGPDYAVWFVTEMGQYLTRIDRADGTMTSVLLSTGNASFLDLTSGPDGRLWLLGTKAISRLTLPLPESGPPLLETIPLDKFVFDSQGRSQIIPGPGAAMHLVNARSQDVQRVSIPGADGRDLQVLVHPFSPIMLMGGVFEISIEVANWSTSPATAVEIQIPLPENVTFLEVGSSRLTCETVSDVLICRLDTLDAGERIAAPFTFHFGRAPGAKAARVFDVRVSSAALDYLPANNRAFRGMAFQRTMNYDNDFSVTAGEHWSHDTITSPDGKLQYLGGFDNDNVTLTFRNLPYHDRADLCFDLYVLGAWDGDQLVDPQDTGENLPLIGPDLWANYMDENKLRVTTYSNQQRLTQSYPAEYNEGVFPFHTGAAETGSFDNDRSVTDSRYHFCIYKPHTRSELKYTFYGANLHGESGEQWALDNISVRLYYFHAFDWLYLPLLMR